MTSSFKRPANKFSKPVKSKIETYISCLPYWPHSVDTIIGLEHRSPICICSPSSFSPLHIHRTDCHIMVFLPPARLFGSCRLTSRFGMLVWTSSYPAVERSETCISTSNHSLSLIVRKHPHHHMIGHFNGKDLRVWLEWPCLCFYAFVTPLQNACDLESANVLLRG